MRTATQQTVLGLVASALVTASAAAQAPIDPAMTQYVNTDRTVGAPNTREGFEGSLTLGGSLNVAHNRFVVGQVEGKSVLLGISLLGNGAYRTGKHEWKGNLNIAETWARTTVIDEFVKSNDVLQLDNIYNYYLAPWTGPFARLEMLTTILPTERVTATDTDYAPTGATVATETTDHFDLAKSFEPFTINESLGWFAQPVSKEEFTLYGRAGFGGRHTFADGARIITNADGPIVFYDRLSDVHQAGVELFAGFDGKAQEGRLQYAAGASALFPLANNDDQNRSTAELTRIMMQGSVGVGIFSWMSLNYLLKVVRDFQMIEEVQVQNSLLLTVSYGVSTPKPEEAAAVDPAIAAANERAAAAEARADAAEARAAAAEAAIQNEPAVPQPAEPTLPSPADPAAQPAPEAAPAAPAQP